MLMSAKHTLTNCFYCIFAIFAKASSSQSVNRYTKNIIYFLGLHFGEALFSLRYVEHQDGGRNVRQ